MPRNSSGTMSDPIATLVTGTVASATDLNTLIADLVAEITNSVSRSGQGTMTGALNLANGLVGTPSLTFGGDINTGLYWISADDFGITCNGVKVAEFTTSGLVIPTGKTITLPLATVTAPTPGANWTASLGLGYWKDSNNVVHLRGAATPAAGAATTIYSLPAGFRPGNDSGFVMRQGITTTPGFVIAASGAVQANPLVIGNGIVYTDGVSFLAEA